MGVTMRLELHRIKGTERATLGNLYINGALECHTLEDVVRDIQPDGTGKIMKETAIPAGTYKVAITFSPKFKRDMPILLDVPYFTGIRIHKGNTDADTWGCILLGQTIAGDDLITHSTEAFAAFLPKLQKALDDGEDVTITVTNDFRG
jgi:hypothetical protein